MLETIKDSLRQIVRYPKEFRIPVPRWPDLAEAIDDIAKAMDSGLLEAKKGDNNDAALKNLAAEMGTSVWRLQRRIPAQGELPEEFKKISRDLKSAWDALRQAGIEVKDHTGEPFDSHLAMSVREFQPTPGLTSDQVIETLSPTIYLKNQMIQRGDVIVGTPENRPETDKPE